MAFWTLPGGIIGSGFALQVEQKNKKKQFNRLVPAAATLIQSWWRMKTTLVLSPSKASSLIATLNTFDLSKPLNNKRQISLRNDILLRSSSSQNGKNDELNNKNEDCSEHLLKDDSVRRSSILLQLSSEHLISIRLIFLLKYFAAKAKFKSAYKPYDFKDDLIEQYARGNLDILLKIKDMQRKFEQFNLIPQNQVPSLSYEINTDENKEFVLMKLQNIEMQVNNLSINLEKILNKKYQ